MAPSFGRSISFPLSLSPARSSSSKARHVRSVSLPCSSHPLLAHLHAHIAAVSSWAAGADPAASVPAAGLAHIHALHAALADLLLLPDPQAALRRAAHGADRLLDAFLLLAEAHQGFQESVLQLRQCAEEERAALRRGDDARLASAARSHRRAEKELAHAHLAASVSTAAAKPTRMGLVSGATAEEAEMAGALMEVAAANASASAIVFSAAASMSTAAFSFKNTAAFAAFTKKAAPETAEVTLVRLEGLEQCIDECDCLCDKVFRSIVRTRVAMLNIMTPTI